ncbi:MAG TPA: FAD-binding oxidoreductase [Candidatus Methylomirabilis sp.]|nr:FAD-binding oxidoreductase [Candidatus Methylomirabilis sp.]
MSGTGVCTAIVEALRSLVGSEHVLAGERLTAYRLGTCTPVAVVQPADETEVSRVLGLASSESLGVVPWGAGAHQCLGLPPNRYDVALDLSRINRLIQHEPADMTATVQAGMRFSELQGHLKTRGQFLSLDPPLAERASLGGVLAANLSGPLRCRYGTARDLVLGVRIAHADGVLTKGGAKVVKNATAYDITKLYVGSHGTLGVILEATLRLFPIPAVEEGWWLPLSDLATAEALARRVLGSHLQPNRVELLDDGARLTCGAPGSGVALMISCAGGREAVQSQAETLEAMARAAGTRLIPARYFGRTWAALRDFPWLPDDNTPGKHRALWRGSVLPADCAKAMHAVHDGTPGGVEGGVAAGVAHGILRGVLRAETAEALAVSLKAARDALEALGGFLVVLDAPAAVREQIDVWGPPADGLGVMRRLKAAFDPKGILNPGRFVGGI